jgi:predicted GIY-YIG superfamily endonuclease
MWYEEYGKSIIGSPSVNVSQGRFILYFIECQTENHFYVGISSALGRRLEKHYRGKGSPFVRKHGIACIRILDSFPTRAGAEAAEDRLTRQLEDSSSYFVVRGGNFNEQGRRGRAQL